MSTTDPFDEMVGQLEAELAGLPTDDVEDVTGLDTHALMTKFHATERALRDRKELHVPRTPEGRDLHSLRYAYQLELRKRHIL